MHWPGFNADGALLLPLEKRDLLAADMPLRLRLDGLVLEQKHELHVTLLNHATASAVLARLDAPTVADAFAAFDWRIIPTQRYALVHKTKDEWDGPLQAWAVIEHLQMPAFAAFRDRLARESGLALDCGIPHVTLYVAGDPAGIGLPDLAAWRACFVREVAADEVRRVTCRLEDPKAGRPGP